MSDESRSTAFDSGKAAVGSVYAKALLEAAEKAGSTTLVLEELDSVDVDVFQRLPRLLGALISPRTPLEEKERTLEKAFSGKMNATTLHFLKVLARRGRFNCLPDVVAAFRRLVNERRGLVEVQVRTAAPINNTLLGRIADRLRGMLGQEVEVHAKVVPELIGGVVVRVGDTLYDGSVARKLQLVRDKALVAAQTAVRDAFDRFSS